MDKQIKKAIDIILKDILKNGISKKHKKDQLDINCPECTFRLLEAYLDWYKDLLEWK